MGDSKNAHESTTKLIENIIKSNIIKLISEAERIKNIRKAKFISLEDICFVIRRNKFKLKRIICSLSFKELRKKIADEVEEIVEIEDECRFDWMIECKKIISKCDGKTCCNLIKNNLDIPVKQNSEFNELNFEQDDEIIRKSKHNESNDNHENEDVNLLNEQCSSYDNDYIERLKRIDLITRNMSINEYLEFTECRQASFTYRKAKKFREFIEFDKIKDEIVDVLGYICYEMVSQIVDEGLKIKSKNDGTGIEKGLFGGKKSEGLTEQDIIEACRKIQKRKINLYN